MEGLVEGIRMVEVAVRRSRGMEAGPLLHAALNMINGEIGAGCNSNGNKLLNDTGTMVQMTRGKEEDAW